MKSTREAKKCTGKIFRGGIFDKGMADVLRTLVVLLLCALCLGSYAREEDKGEEAELSTVSRSMQESTEAVAKTYGGFSENEAQTSTINHQPSDINPHTSDIAHHTSDINPHTSDINPQLSDSAYQPSEPKPVVALRTNLLYDAALVPNIGVEVGLGKGFTLAADWFGTWLFSDKNHWYWQGYGGYLTARYYFDKDNPQYSLTPGQMLSSGHHVGIYGTALTYDVEFGGIGYQAAQFGFGGGVEYGYSLKVAQSLCIDFNLGLGYQGGEYKKYMPTDDGSGHYVWMSTHRRHWFGPTKAEISLKWLIGPYEKKTAALEKKDSASEKKGGAR